MKKTKVRFQEIAETDVRRKTHLLVCGHTVPFPTGSHKRRGAQRERTSRLCHECANAPDPDRKPGTMASMRNASTVWTSWS